MQPQIKLHLKGNEIPVGTMMDLVGADRDFFVKNFKNTS
jgi:hypothetical protein